MIGIRRSLPAASYHNSNQLVSSAEAYLDLPPWSACGLTRTMVIMWSNVYRSNVIYMLSYLMSETECNSLACRNPQKVE